MDTQIKLPLKLLQELKEDEILALETETFRGVEADVVWCLSKLIDDI